MEEMNQQQFEELFGTESLERINYIELFENSKMHVDLQAVLGMLLNELANTSWLV